MVPLSVTEVGEELLPLQEKKSMHIRSQEVIAETGAALETFEQHWRGTRFADRVRMVRLVKSETAKTMQAYASLLGYSERQLLRWWACYKNRKWRKTKKSHDLSTVPFCCPSPVKSIL